MEVSGKHANSVPDPREDTARSYEKCKTHSSENIKYYCPKHDMVTCDDCNVADHNGCKIEFISVLAKKFEKSSEFKEIVKSLEKLEVENIESKKQLANNRKENKAFLDKALSEIKKFRKEINDHLDKVEKEVESEANKRSNEIKELMSNLEKITSVAEQEIADLRKNLDPKIIKGETLFIRIKEYKPKLSKLDGNIAYIRTNNVLKGFIFEQEKQLAGIIRSGIKLGCLRMDTAPGEAPAVKQNAQQQRNEVLKWTAEKHVDAKQKFVPPDPRAAGFGVGSSVWDNRIKLLEVRDITAFSNGCWDSYIDDKVNDGNVYWVPRNKLVTRSKIEITVFKTMV